MGPLFSLLKIWLLMALKACHTRYYSNYLVCEAWGDNAQHEYYSQEVPNLIHVAETTYMEAALCKLFTVQMPLEQYDVQAALN